ncbi:hypothetical protein [Brevundimonas subvibrioides]|uniref:hypothetical protein n=1 Tax=Brevundimonas subvibrioides TaxID=74313 RepID=UPI0022B365EB|nr:hypothetical protein [Brevundimonas subvibrioides]
MLHIHREILELAASADVGPSMPPPLEIELAVTTLIERELLIVQNDRISITAEGRKALAA